MTEKRTLDMTDSNRTTHDMLSTLIENLTGMFDPDEKLTEGILAEFVVIPRSELPKIEGHHEEHVVRCGHDTFYIPPTFDHSVTWAQAYQALAVAEYADQKVSAQAATEAKRNARRNELSREMCIKAYGVDATVGDYQNASAPLQSAIDRIIELEEAAA